MDEEKRIYIIAGPNGAGKTTASFVLLPEYLGIREFVNADEIARGLSPFNPEKAAFEAGRIMLQRIDYLLQSGISFAFETTLSTRSYKSFVQKAQASGYYCHLLFFALPNPEMAVNRVAQRVQEGRHNIPVEVIQRRYERGLVNLFGYYGEVMDEVSIFDNRDEAPLPICRKADTQFLLQDPALYDYLLSQKSNRKLTSTTSASSLALRKPTVVW